MHGDSGGLTVDNLSVEYAGVVFAIAESPEEKGQIWAGTNDGQVQMTRDGGQHWTNLTANFPGLPPKMTVDSIEPSKYDAGTCYVAFDGHQVDIFDPYLYKTTDYGKTWTKITSGIEPSPLSYTHVLREDPIPPRPALRRHRERPLYLHGRRRALGALPAQPAPRPCLLAHHPAHLRRSGHRHLRPRLLDPRRPLAPAAHESRERARRVRTLPRPQGLSPARRHPPRAGCARASPLATTRPMACPSTTCSSPRPKASSSTSSTRTAS